MENGIQNWVPIKILEKPNDTQCRWLYIGNKKFTEPFFDETISACKQLPINWSLKASISANDLLPQLSSTISTIAPTAFIFHISRCGSTLLSQMLSKLPQNIVLSEVPFIDALLRKGMIDHNMEQMLPIVKAAIEIYAQKRHAEEQNVFIKLDSWHIHFYKELRQLYPTTPFFLLYRKPYEVLQSQQKKRGMQSLPNYLEPEIFGFTKETIKDKGLDEYMALVLETYFNCFLKIVETDINAHLLHYHDGIDNLFEKICEKTSLKLNDIEKTIVSERIKFNAKNPLEKFTESMRTDAVPYFLNNCNKLYTALHKLHISPHSK